MATLRSNEIQISLGFRQALRYEKRSFSVILFFSNKLGLNIKLTISAGRTMISLDKTQSRTERKILQQKRKSLNLQYKRKVATIEKNINILVCKYGAKATLILYREGRYDTYQSSELKPWQPSLEEIVRSSKALWMFF